MSGKKLQGSRRSFDKYCANDKIISLGPKRSIEKNQSKNSRFHGDKRFWPIFPLIIGCDKAHGTMRKGLQAILTISVNVMRAFLLYLRVLKKKGKLSSGEKTLVYFFSYYRT